MSAVRFKSINRDSRLQMVLDIVLTNLLKAFKNPLILTNTKNLTELAFFHSHFNLLKIIINLLPESNLSFPLTIGRLRKKGHLTNNIFSAAIEYLMSLYLFHLNCSSLVLLNQNGDVRWLLRADVIGSHSLCSRERHRVILRVGEDKAFIQTSLNVTCDLPARFINCAVLSMGALWKDHSFFAPGRLKNIFR